MISILLPSRKRPRNIARFINSFYQNSRGEIEFWFYIDNDDGENLEELKYQKKEYDGLVDINWIVGERKAISNTYNDLFLMVEKPDILLISGDDVTANTEGWDLIVSDAFNEYPDRLVLVGGYDLLNESLFTTFCLSKEFVDVTGFLMPNGFWDYADTTSWDIFSKINRIKKINVEFEHHHCSNNKAVMDITMKEKNILCYGSLQPSHIKYSQESKWREQIAEKLRIKINESKN